MNPIDFCLKVWSWNVPKGKYVCVSTKKDSLWKDHVFKYDGDLRSKLEELFEPGDRNYYFCPNGFTGKRRHLDYAIPGRFLWADLDNARPSHCTPRPTVAVESSPNRFVGLWHLDDRLDLDELLNANRSLTYRVGADKGGWDYTQVLRIPGTKNFKYKQKPEVKLLWWKNATIPTPKDFKKEILAKYKTKLSARARQMINTKDTLKADRSSKLWNLENEMLQAGMKPQEVIVVLKDTPWNKYRGRRDEDERFEAEIMKIINKEIDEEEDSESEKSEERVKRRANAIVRMSDVEPEAVHWIWYPYIPRGKLTLVEGDPSLGKSWITFAIASHISRRKRLPNMAGKPPGGRVLLMSAEDGLGDTIRPRLNSLDADVKKVFAYAHPITLDEDGVETLENQIAELRPLAVFIDPLVAYMGGAIDLHKANQTREFTARLGELAERYGIAIIGVRHLTKGARDKAMYRGIGSIDLTAAARSVLHVGQDPEDEESRVIVHIKSNLAPLGPSIRYTLKRGTTRPFKWMGTTRLRATDLAQTDKDVKGHEDVERCVTFLRERLREPVAAEIVLRDAEAKGFSQRLVKRCREQLHIEAVRHEGRWIWEMYHG